MPNWISNRTSRRIRPTQTNDTHLLQDRAPLFCHFGRRVSGEQLRHLLQQCTEGAGNRRVPHAWRLGSEILRKLRHQTLCKADERVFLQHVQQVIENAANFLGAGGYCDGPHVVVPHGHRAAK